jgi:hypothetical protein
LFNAAIEKVLTCYDERQHYPGLGIRAVHIDCVVCITSSEMTALRKAHTKSSSTGLSKSRNAQEVQRRVRAERTIQSVDLF